MVGARPAGGLWHVRASNPARAWVVCSLARGFRVRVRNLRSGWSGCALRQVRGDSGERYAVRTAVAGLWDTPIPPTTPMHRGWHAGGRGASRWSASATLGLPPRLAYGDAHARAQALCAVCARGTRACPHPPARPPAPRKPRLEDARAVAPDRRLSDRRGVTWRLGPGVSMECYAARAARKEARSPHSPKASTGYSS